MFNVSMSQIVCGTYHLLSFSFFKKEINRQTGSSPSQSHTFACMASSLPPPHPFQREPHPSLKVPSPSKPWIPASPASQVFALFTTQLPVYSTSHLLLSSLPHAAPNPAPRFPGSSYVITFPSCSDYLE